MVVYEWVDGELSVWGSEGEGMLSLIYREPER